MRHLLGSADAARVLFALALALFVAGCPRNNTNDAMDAARRAIEDSAAAAPCAEAEYNAARSLLEQAEEAYANRDYARARQFAEAASEQADYARQVAADNEEDCNRLRGLTEEVEQVQDTRNVGVPVDTDYVFVPVFFDYDASTLTVDAQRILDGHAAQMVANPDWRMQVAGHCDTRGTTQYNLALGDRRARAVKEYLVRMGVEPDRVATISYGAELPVSSEHDRNRRAEFQVRR